mgnify:CR=1 FL=1
MKIFFLYFIHVLGLFYFLGAPENLVKSFVLFLTFFVLIVNINKIKFYKYYLYLFLFIIFIFQSFSNFSDVISFGFPFIILFTGSFLFNLYKNFKEDDVKFHIKNLIYVSLFGVFLKLILHGIDEGFLIGFLSMNAGQLGFLFPSLMLIFIFELFKDNKTRILFFILLFLFAIINEKRSIIFFFPIILIYYQGFRILNLNKFIPAIALYCLALFLIPSLNPDNKAFGTIDIFYPFQYALEYLTATYDGGLQGNKLEAITNTGSQYGRFALLQSIIDFASNYFTQSNILFGHGMGTFTLSASAETYFDDTMFKLLGFRGTLSTALIIFLDSGFIALTFFILFLFRYLIFLFRDIKLNHMILLIVFYDIFFYSDAFLKILPISIYFFTLFPFVFYRKINKDIQ